MHSRKSKFIFSGMEVDDAAPQNDHNRRRNGRGANQRRRQENRVLTDEEGLSILEEVLVMLPKHSVDDNGIFVVEDARFELLQRAAGDRAVIKHDSLMENEMNDSKLAAMAETCFTVIRTAVEDDLDLMGRNQQPIHFRILPEAIGVEQFTLEMLYAFSNLLGISGDGWPESMERVSKPVVLDTYTRILALMGMPASIIVGGQFFNFLSCPLRRTSILRAFALFFFYITRNFLPWITETLAGRVDEQLVRRVYARLAHFRRYTDSFFTHFDGSLELGFATENLAKTELLRHRFRQVAEEENVRFAFLGRTGITLQRVPRLGPNGERIGFFDYYRSYRPASASTARVNEEDRFSDRALASASTLKKDGFPIEEWIVQGPLNYERSQRDGSLWYTHQKMENRDAPVQILRTMTELRAKPVRLTKQQWRNGTFDSALWKFWPFDGPQPPPDIANHSASALFPNDDFPLADMINGSVSLGDLSFTEHRALQTPSFDRVFADQGFPPGSPMYIWALCMLGRLHFPFNTPIVTERNAAGEATAVMKNDLTLMLYIYGKGGSGKSTIADAMKYIFSDGGACSPVGQPTLTPRVVSSLSNQTEEKFALAKAKDNMVLIAAEVSFFTPYCKCPAPIPSPLPPETGQRRNSESLNGLPWHPPNTPPTSGVAVSTSPAPSACCARSSSPSSCSSRNPLCKF